MSEATKLDRTFQINKFFKRRLDPDYVSRMKNYERELFRKLKEIGKTRAFWSP
jgi:muconolactone delta-isomerase